jgi:hypothetical protein
MDSSFQKKMLEYMMFTDPSKLIAMPEQSYDSLCLGEELKYLFKKGVLTRMWIDCKTQHMMVS